METVLLVKKDAQIAQQANVHCVKIIEGMTCDLSCGDETPFYDYIYGMCAPDCGDYGVALNYSYAGLKTPYCAYCDDNCNECDVVK